MSAYDDYDEPRRHRSHRHRDRDDGGGYVETRETHVRSGPPDGAFSNRTDLIPRPRREDSDLSVEEVRRDFPPPAGAYLATRERGSGHRARSADRGSNAGSYADDRHSKRGLKGDERDSRRRSLSRNQKIIAGVAGAALALGGKELYDRRKNHGAAPEHRNLVATAALGAAGAFAGYEGADFAAKRLKPKDKNRGSGSGSDSEDDGDHKKPSRRKSIVEGALGLAGLGAAAKAASGGHNDRDGDRSGRSRRDSGASRDGRDSRRSRSRGPEGGSGEGIAKFQQAAKAALLAGATEAFRVRNEPGGWAGPKGRRILTAAIGAGGIDAAADRNPDSKSKRHILEAVIGGLAGNRLINGSRDDIQPERSGRSGGGRSRSRARAPSQGPGAGTGLAALATAGLGALAGKKLLDRSKSRDRDGDDRDRRRRSFSDDDDDRGKPRKRSKSVTDYARKGLAALGIGEAAKDINDRDDDRDHDRRRDGRRDRDRDDDKPRRSRRQRSPSQDSDYDDRARGVPYGDSRSNAGRDDGRSARKKDNGRNRRIAEGKEFASDSDLGSSTDDEKKVKKMRAPRY